MPSRTSPPAPRRSGGIFDYDAKKSRLIEVARALEDPRVWDDPKKAQELGRERSALEALVGSIEKIGSGLGDCAELFSMARAEEDDGMLRSVANEVQGLEKLLGELEFQRMFDDPMDPNNCFIDLNAGQGGTEAQDWVSMLLRMYLKYCDRKGFKAELLEESPGEVAGLKSASVKVTAPYASRHSIPTRAAIPPSRASSSTPRWTRPSRSISTRPTCASTRTAPRARAAST
jgi:peptide chain release factor 2